jgi:hypothetical protein
MKIRFIVAAFATLFTISSYGQMFEPKIFEGPGSEYFTRYHWADFNADGAFDILEIDFYSKATLHISNGTSFNSLDLESENIYFEEGRYAFNDYDRDGDIDILASNGQALVIVNYDEGNGFTLVGTGITFTYVDSGKIHWLDLDGDLDLDVLHGRKIFLNHQGIYAESQELLPELLSNMVLDDINGDGLTDIVTGGYEAYDGTEVSIFLNEGQGHFKQTSAPMLPVTKLQSNTIALLDVDGDSDIDVFAIDLYARGWIFKNSLAQTGQMSFTAVQIFTNISLISAIAGDINSDGLQDIVGAGQTALTVLKNTSSAGTISFVPESYEADLQTFLGLALVDIDGDNDLDIHLKGYSYNGSGNLMFEKTGIPPSITSVTPTNLSSIVDKNVSLSWNSQPKLLYIIEVKRNGVIYKSSSTSPSGKLLLTSGNFLRRNGSLILRGLPAGSYEWRVQALDASGRSSIFSTTNTFDINNGPSSLTLQATDLRKIKLCWTYSGNDNPSIVVFRKTSWTAAIEIAQVNAGITCYEDNAVPENQKVEYFVVAANGGIYSAPSNTLIHHSTLFVESSFGMANPNIITARCFPADFDMDGDYDLEFIGRVGYNDNNFLLKNNEDGTYTPTGPLITADAIILPYTEMVGARDIDNDGDPDMVVITGSDYSWQKVSVFINNNGAFTLGFETPAYLGIFQLDVEDMNNDGRLDLLFSNNTGNSSNNARQYQLLYQTADGGFEDSHIVLSNTESTTIAYFRCVDLNNDGFLDIIWSWSDKNYADILVNQEGSSFSKKTSILPVTYLMAVDDYTGDGNIDVMVLGNEGMNLYYGTGDFSFAEPKVIPIESLSTSPMFVSADFDLNGLTDVLFTDGYNSQIILNRGNGSFKASDINFGNILGSSFSITDFENDGDIDIIKTGSDGQHQGLNYFYKNQSANINIVNAPPTSPGALTAIYESGKSVFTWSSATDDRTPSKVLTYNLSIVDANGKVWLSPETNESGTFRRRMAPGNAGHSNIKTLNNLSAGVYSVRVQAIDASFALSPWSQQIQLTIQEGPTALAIERVLLNKVKLTWNGSSFTETKVVLQRRTAENKWEVITELPAGSTMYTDENLVYNKLYEYRIFEASETSATATSNIAQWSTNMWVLQDTDIANLYGSMDVADFTGDGLMDMALNGAMIYNGYNEDITRATFENTATGWVKRDITSTNLQHTAEIAFTDLNGDFKPDIYQHGYVYESGYKTEALINNGNKTFNSTTNVFTNGNYAIKSYFDFDMDNDLDVSVIKAGSYPALKEIFQNNGEGNYSSMDLIGCNNCPDVSAADFDKDGDEDIMRLINGNYQLYLNTPNGLIPTSATFLGYETKVFVTDYNNDGLPDVVLLTSSYYRTGKIFKNLGLQSDNSIKFMELPVDLSTGEASMLSADFNFDGNTDLVVLSPYINILLSNGDDTFQQFTEPGLRLSLHVAGLIDYDNDGDLDIYFSGYHIKNNSEYGRKAKVMLNQTIVSAVGIKNNPPSAPQNLSSKQDSLGVHLSWSLPIDDHTRPEGITYDVVLFHDGKTISKGSHDPATGQRSRLTPGRSTGVTTLNNLPIGSYSWYVQAIDGSFAASNFSETGTFIFLPVPPGIKDTVIYRCNRTITLTAKGNDIKWYKDENLTILIASGEFHPTETQTVYVVQTINGYQGIPKRVQIEINEKPPIPLFSQINPYLICEGSGIQTLSAMGENVRWYSDAILSNLVSSTSYIQVPASEATYFATQTIEDCVSNTLAAQVKVITINPQLYFKDGKIFSREEEGDNYYWYRNGFYYRSTTVPHIPFDGETASYVVSVTKGQCLKYSEPFISNITSTEEMPESILTIFPNPATSNVTIRGKQTNLSVKIFDSTGKLIYSSATISGNEHVINTTHWSKGFYIIVVDNMKDAYTKRLVIF